MSVKSDMERIRSTFEKYSELMDENIIGVKLACYSIPTIALTIALRRVRPFSRFKKPSDIPNRFVRERRDLTGTVRRIEPGGALLMIDHKPLIALPGTKSRPLPVKISGVDVAGHGISWLQTIVAGQEVKFIPVLKEKDWVHCEVFLDQQTHKNKLQTINVGESLVQVGFGTLTNVEKPLSSNIEHNKYFKQLRLAEDYALKKKLGLKYYVKPAKIILASLLARFIKSITQTQTRPQKKPSSLQKLAAA